MNSVRIENVKYIKTGGKGDLFLADDGEYRSMEDRNNHFVYLIDVVDVNVRVRVGAIGVASTPVMTVEWGDGDETSTPPAGGELEHSYPNPGLYTVRIFADRVDNCITPKGANLTKVLNLPDGLKNLDEAFTGRINLTECCDLPNTVQRCKSTFRMCVGLTTPPKLSKSLREANLMFYECTSLVSMASFDGLGDVDCTRMYERCTSLVDCEPINDNITICDYMFVDCTSLVIPPALGEGITNCSRMFERCSSLMHTPVFVDSLVDCKGMFRDCTSLVSAYPVKTESASDMFIGCTSLVKPPHIEEGVLDCTRMFQDCVELTGVTPYIPNSVTNCEDMFAYCKKITKVSNFPSGLVIGRDMFYGCTELVDIPRTLPQSLVDGFGMFSGCIKLTTAAIINHTISRCEFMFRSTAITSLPTENVQLMMDVYSGVNTTLSYYSCYLNCTEITSPDTYENYREGIYKRWFIYL